jgi:hypothetical protein
VLWILGDIVGLPFLAAQLIQMIREDEHDAEVIDAELDAREAAEAAATAASGPALAGAEAATAAAPSAAGSVPSTQRPWWETDSRFADRFRALDEADGK